MCQAILHSVQPTLYYLEISRTEGSLWEPEDSQYIIQGDVAVSQNLMGQWDLTGLLITDVRTDLVIHTIYKTMLLNIFFGADKQRLLPRNLSVGKMQ